MGGIGIAKIHKKGLHIPKNFGITRRRRVFFFKWAVLAAVQSRSKICSAAPAEVYNSWIPLIQANLTKFLLDPDVFPAPKCFKPERFIDEHGKIKRIEQFSP